MTRTQPLHWKVVVDAADPHRQASFWSDTLGYTLEDHSGLIEHLLGLGVVTDADTVEYEGRRAWREAAAVRHPDDPYAEESGTGLGRRILFNRVPEPKTGKNRLHLDVHTGAGADERAAEVARLTSLGAAVQREVKEQGGEWVVMTDPEGNEFCVH
ncbi:VOC family protein [Streptomyces sp. NPDC058001]|uniref:VOC family protein n=1 Tax=Streptomyces sp. NPDC058001 TaxID=3346300 RepID=UPI0036ED2619